MSLPTTLHPHRSSRPRWRAAALACLGALAVLGYFTYDALLGRAMHCVRDQRPRCVLRIGHEEVEAPLAGLTAAKVRRRKLASIWMIDLVYAKGSAAVPQGGVLEGGRVGPFEVEAQADRVAKRLRDFLRAPAARAFTARLGASARRVAVLLTGILVVLALGIGWYRGLPTRPTAGVVVAALLGAALPGQGGCTRDRAPPPLPAARPAARHTSATPALPLRRPTPSLPPAPRTRARLVLVGDTGEPGPQRDAVFAAIRAERKDYVVALGDVVYPRGPRCPEGRLTPRARALLDERLGDALARLGAPVLLVLGNHDVGHRRRSPAREACFLAYAASHPRLKLPALSYSLDLGVALLEVLNTNALGGDDGARIAREVARHRGWKIFLGHHVLATFRDKVGEDRVRPWLQRHGLRPDLYANGHAHLLQFGVYGGIPAVTSGTGAKVRVRATCPPRCGPGERFGRSDPGYAVLQITPERLAVTFKDQRGAPLWSWTSPERRSAAPR